jgi:type IV secretory pathway VirB2 component (pilin)
MKFLNKIFSKTSFAVTALYCYSSGVFATTVGGQYPWDSMMQKLSSDLQSNFAIFVGIVALIICGGFVMFGDLQGGARKAFNVGLGLSVMLNVGTILTSLFGASGAIIF